MRIGHEMIFASAGSGKTHALTTRFIRLLAMGVAPERIAALTFTRKAAGEFFAEILHRIAGAAENPAAAKRLAADVGQPQFGPEAFTTLLRQLVDQMHRLSLGTLDGFFARVVRAFPLELGLAGEPSVLDERAAREESRRILSRLLAPRGGLAPEQKALIEAFKLATFGTEDKAVAERLDSFVDRNLALFRAASAEVVWGGVERIWPEGFPWGDPQQDPAPAAAALREWAAGAELKDKQRERWLRFADAAETWAPGGPMPGELTFVLKKALESWSDVQDGCAELRFDRVPQRLSREACRALTMLVRRVIALELGRRLAVTQGIGSVLRAFDTLYDVEVRRSGRLTFADLQQILMPAAVGLRLGLGGESSEPRLQLDYRLDATLDHWMFDEFQDTSFPQWQVLENLVDEVMQDPTGRRSFFFVGDIKQAIYTWREGDPRLFSYVADRYNARLSEGIVPRELNDSWRSGPAVIELVNRVCGNGAVMEGLFPEAAGEWNRYWRAHHTARPERSGQSALLLAEDEASRWACVLNVLQALEPTRRGLTCAVLVRTNETGARLADFLRREGGIAAVAEADLRIAADNPVTAALAALLQAAAHPGDSLAQAHVAMSPLGDLLSEMGLVTGTEVSLGVLRAVQTKGFRGWVEDWIIRLYPVLGSDDAFSRLRLRQFAQAAQVFDDTQPSGDVDAFLRFIADYTVREPEGADVVRVMTIHKSKGLGFDVVLLPDLEGDKLAQRRKGPAVRKRLDRAIDWVLEFPGDLVAQHDPVLREYLSEAVAENCYEQLSLLYVALTRAKYAVYAVIEPPGRSTSLNFPRLLTETLGADEATIAVGSHRFRGTWTTGDSGWFSAHQAMPTVSAAPERLPVIAGTRVSVLTPRTPSAEKFSRLNAADLFGSRASEPAEFGREVHALLAEIEWAPFGELELLAWEAKWMGRGTGSPDAITEAVACLQAPRLQQVWARPGLRASVWREKPFELVRGEEWVTGVLDRVVLEADQLGRPLRATVFDFKTDRLKAGESVGRAARRHGGQLEIYRDAVAQLTGLSPAAVTMQVVFTAIREHATLG